MHSIGRASMLEMIEGLSPEQQQVLTLKFVFNFSNGEAATILGKTEGAIKSLQHRALVSLQKQLGAGRRTTLRSAVALEVGIVGCPTREDDALPRADEGGPAATYGKANVGMADDRRRPARRGSRTVVGREEGDAGGDPGRQDVPGTGPALLGGCARSTRCSRWLDGFSGTPSRDDLETLKLELLVADRDHVERRLERATKQAKSGDAEAAQGGRRRSSGCSRTSSRAGRSRTGRASFRRSSIR